MKTLRINAASEYIIMEDNQIKSGYFSVNIKSIQIDINSGVYNINIITNKNKKYSYNKINKIILYSNKIKKQISKK